MIRIPTDPGLPLLLSSLAHCLGDRLAFSAYWDRRAQLHALAFVCVVPSPYSSIPPLILKYSTPCPIAH